MNRYQITIEGMSCQHCVKSVSEALNAIAQVESVDVYLDKGTAIVDAFSVDEGFTSTMKRAIEDIGFDVMSIEECK